MLVKDRFLNIYKRDLRESTRKSYKTTLDKLYSKFNITEDNEENKLKDLTCNDLEDWCLELEKEYKGSSYNTMVTHLREYFLYLAEKRHLLTSNPFDVVQKLGYKEVELDAKDKYIFSIDDIKRIIARSRIRSTRESIHSFEFNSHRDRAIISMLMATGCRKGELINLQYSMMEKINGGVAFNISGKYTKNGNDKRIVIGNNTLKYFNEYLMMVEKYNIDSEYIFTSMRGKKLNSSDLTDIVKKLVKKSGIETGDKMVSPHCCRSSLAVYLVQQNISEIIVKEIMGWNQSTSNSMLAKYSTKDITMYDEDKLKILNII